jgi:hypothetical protein
MVTSLGLKIHLYGKRETSQRNFSFGFPAALAYQAAPKNLDEIRFAFVV